MPRIKLFLLVLFVGFLSFGGLIQKHHMAVVALKNVSSCDSCASAGTLFSWHAENVDVALGTPCGCSMGDTTATANDSVTLSNTQAKDGTYSIYAADSTKYYAFTGVDEDIVHIDESTVTFWVYIVTWVESARLFRVYGDADNFIVIRLIGDGSDAANRDIGLYWKGQTTIDTLNTTVADLALNTWYGIKVEWKIQAGVDCKISLCKDGDDVFDDAVVSVDDDIVDWSAGTKASFVLGCGESQGIEAAFYEDKIKVEDGSSL